ncbi:MAG: NADH-quinone oxidoreductase subunit NuoG, partial [Sphingobacteriales bacterium]
GVTDGAALVDPPADLADDPLADVHQLGVVAETDIGQLHLAADLDEHPARAIDHDVGDIVARQQRLERPIAEDVVDDVLDEHVLLGHRHRHVLDRHQFGDDVPDLFGCLLGVQLGQLRQIDRVDQGVEDDRLGRVIVVALLANDLGRRRRSLGRAKLLEGGGRLWAGDRLATLGLGLDLPYFCWHPSMGSIGACRQCAVKVFRDNGDTKGRLVMSCMENARDGMYLSVNDKEAVNFRAQIIEWLMTNHPHDCPVCDEGGSCHLQDMTVMTGHNYRRFRYKKRTFPNQYLGPLIHHEMNRCIQCYRCVRFYRDYAGGTDLNVFAAHHHVYFGREKDGVLESPFSGNLAEVCPTGVFTDKLLKEHYTRKWDLTTAPTICQHCSLGCNVIAGERYGTVRSIGNRFNGAVNGYFLCDRGRFGYDFVNSINRVQRPLVRTRPIESVDEDTLMDELNKLIAPQKLIGIGSPRASVESNFALMRLVGKQNFYQGISEELAYIEKRIVDILQSGNIHSASLKEIEMADAVLILGEDVWNTAPVMALAVRQSVMKTAAQTASEQLVVPVWQDAAIKEFIQEDKGFLANLTVVDSPLDLISSTALHDAPDNIARLGFTIAHLLNPALPPVHGIDEATMAVADSIASTLKTAKRPVIISGTSCYNEALVRAACLVATSLNNNDRKVGISYVMSQCNSMGLAMMRAPSAEGALKRLSFENDLTLVVIENDLYRFMPAKKADPFFKSFKNIIVLDSLNNATTEKATVL